MRSAGGTNLVNHGAPGGVVYLGAPGGLAWTPAWIAAGDQRIEGHAGLRVPPTLNEG